MQRIDVPHHTIEQVENYVRLAVKMADEIELDVVDRTTLLPTMVTLLASKSVQLQPDSPMTLPTLKIPRDRH